MQEKLRRMAKAYIDRVFPDVEYHRQNKLLEMELEPLVVPAEDAAEDAGHPLLNLKKLWTEAGLGERRKLLQSILNAARIDARKSKPIVAIRLKPPSRPVSQVAASRAGSDIRILSEPPNGSGVFLVEAGETLSLPETRFGWLNGLIESQVPMERLGESISNHIQPRNHTEV